MNKQGHVLNAALLGVGLAFVFEPSGTAAETVRAIVGVTIPVTLGALLPDVDTVIGEHRETLHNLPILGVFVAFPFVFGNLRYVWIGILTHFVLDYFGSLRGIAAFYPLSDREYGSPTGVTTSSQLAPVVTIIVTVVELATAVVVVHVVPAALRANGLPTDLPF